MKPRNDVSQTVVVWLDYCARVGKGYSQAQQILPHRRKQIE
jgi:hypothetical protein